MSGAKTHGVSSLSKCSNRTDGFGTSNPEIYRVARKQKREHRCHPADLSVHATVAASSDRDRAEVGTAGRCRCVPEYLHVVVAEALAAQRPGIARSGLLRRRGMVTMPERSRTTM